MRIIFVLAGSALLGIAIAVLLVQPGAAAGEESIGARAKTSSACERAMCESRTWLRAPVMRRANSTR
jgi:hypothetical protein